MKTPHLESLLSEAELASLKQLIAEATKQGAQAVMWHSAASAIAIIGFCQDGELVTWFATPAATEAEALVARSVVLLGVAQASHTMASIQSGAQTVAEEVIRKAMR